MPEAGDETILYRMVLEHVDFGIHNILIEQNQMSNPRVTSFFDWGTGSIVPALLPDPLVAVRSVDLTVDDSGAPKVIRIPKHTRQDELSSYQDWASRYIGRLHSEAPELEAAIVADKHMRYLWFALSDWRGADPEGFFGALGLWAEERMEEARS